jgi:PPOX class probable F420-dependent enzyme
MAVPLSDFARRLLDDRSFATVATLNADGSPQTSVVWVKRDGDRVLFSTTATRLKARNIARDPRVSVTLFPLDDPYHSVEIRGTAELIPDPGRTLSLELSRKYTGGDPPPERAEIERLVVSITPERVVEFQPA